MIHEGMHESDVPFCPECERYPKDGATFLMPFGSSYSVCDDCRKKGGDNVGRCAVCGEYIDPDNDAMAEVVEKASEATSDENFFLVSILIHQDCYDPAKHEIA